MNRPRLRCPKCGGPMKRIYTQEVTTKEGRRRTKYQTLEGFGYCPHDDEAYRVAPAAD